MIAPIPLSRICAVLQLPAPRQERMVRRVVLDSREVADGDLFVAVKGRRVDGHEFLHEVREAGAVAALVTRSVDSDLPQLQVENIHAALGAIARLNRQAFSGPVLAVTGSAGKTTCKDMMASILSRCGPVLATRGNRNNELGLPLTLLDLAPEHRFAVLEMGAAREGDIAWLCRFALPDVALVTNALPAHLDGFGSVEAVARGKGEIYRAVAEDGVAIIQLDGPFSELWRGYAGGARVLSYGLEAPLADIHARKLRTGTDGQHFELVLPGGSVEVKLALLGRHNVLNACAAASAAFAVGADAAAIAAGLAAMRPVARRLEPRRDGRGRLLIDDSYNANPEAVRAAIDVLAACDGRRALLLGDMAELGEDSSRFHRQVGHYAAEAGIDVLWAAGARAGDVVQGFGTGSRAFAHRDALCAALDELQVDVLLVKGSRSAGMDQVVDALCVGADGEPH